MCKLGEELNTNNNKKVAIGEFKGSRLQTGLKLDYRLYKLSVISQERLKIEIVTIDYYAASVGITTNELE